VPQFDDVITSPAPVEEVWKLLYDPARFPDWWAGIATVRPPADAEPGDFTLYPDGHPDFPMPQTLRASDADHQVTVSCLVNELVFAWHLEALEDSGGTRIAVHVEIPESEAFRLDDQRGALSASLRSLAALAAATDVPPARG
jgi:uncharacterized protein YndB with AHSA1/START domain